MDDLRLRSPVYEASTSQCYRAMSKCNATPAKSKDNGKLKLSLVLNDGGTVTGPNPPWMPEASPSRLMIFSKPMIKVMVPRVGLGLILGHGI